MDYRIGIVAVALAVASCGGGSGSGSGGATGGTPTPTPAPTPTPTPTASPTPAGPTYPTYTQLTGNQAFRTSCAGLRQDGSPFRSLPVTPFGTGLTLSYDAGADAYAIAGDGSTPIGTGLSFAAADRNADAPATVRAYRKTVDGFVHFLSIGYPATLGVVPDYVRGFSLRAPLFGETRGGAGAGLQYSCVFGVPTLLTDRPDATQVVFTRIAVNGTAYVLGNGPAEVYSLAPSVATFSVDLVAGRVKTAVQLKGYLQTASGPSSTVTELGSYTGEVEVDDGYYNGTLDTADRVNVASSFGGWFFGPQGREAGFAIAIMAGDNATGRTTTAIGNVVALR